MSDDLDDLLRRAMKTLDDQVPSGYFEGLPNRTLARLEDSSMQTTSGTGTGMDKSSPTGIPPQERDEDSGLHDIRSMASSAKMRISSRRVSTSPPVDDDILASSSAGWKAVALPEPARMVSLPDITPPVEEKSKRDSKKELKAERASAKKIAKEAIAVETSKIAAPAPAPVAAAPVATKPDVAVTPIIGARFAQHQQKSRVGLYAVIGLGLAAAAGGAFYVVTQKKSADTSAVATTEQVAAKNTAPQAPPVTATPIAAGSAAAVAAPEEPKADLAIATDSTTVAVDEGKEEATGAAGVKRPASKAANKKGKDEKAQPIVETKPDATPPPKDAKKDGAKKNPDDQDPSFEALLKEAGVQDKKPAHVALEKKSLSGADIKKGMGGVASKAQACYAGTQGTAQVKLTVAPSGQIQKVSVTGVFAGTPVGACVENAVKGASFPAWEGGPQSFGYSYLLAE